MPAQLLPPSIKFTRSTAALSNETAKAVFLAKNVKVNMRTNITCEALNKPPNNLRELQNYSQVIYDLIDQVLEYYIKKEKLWDQDILLESASYSAKGRCLKKVLKEAELLALKKWLKVARYGRY